VEPTAVIAIVAIAIGLMIGMTDARRAWGSIGAVLGTLVLLVALPPIIVGIWHSLLLWQQSGIIVLGVTVGWITVRLSTLRKATRKRKH
jgi:hypothetical protein